MLQPLQHPYLPCVGVGDETDKRGGCENAGRGEELANEKMEMETKKRGMRTKVRGQREGASHRRGGGREGPHPACR